MPGFLKIAGPALFGFLLFVAGFVYDVMFAGIPYQDPPPELQAQWEFHSTVAFWTMSAGGVIMAVGLLAIPFLGRKKG